VAVAILRRIFSLIFTIWLAASLAFFALRLLPGDAITTQFAQTGTPEGVIAARRAELGLDVPVHVQYQQYLFGLMRGDLGQSLYGGQTVNEMLAQRLGTTLKLAGLSMCLAVVLGLALGILAGLRSSLVSKSAALCIDLAISVPVYWTGTLALFIIAARIGGIQRGIFLPVFVLGYHTAGAIARVIQVNLMRTYDLPFVLTARSKGLSGQYILWKHILKLSLLPALTVTALQAGFLLSGTVITETIFQRPGLGLLLRDATLQRNYPVVQGIVIVSAVAYLAANTLADFLTTLLDPRVTLA